jgi:hypothetical protein
MANAALIKRLALEEIPKEPKAILIFAVSAVVFCTFRSPPICSQSTITGEFSSDASVWHFSS